MTAHHYPDNLYADALANSQKPTGAYDARKLREETIAIAQSQDRDNDCLVSILAAWRAVRKQQDDVYARLVKLAERKPLPDRYDLKQGEAKSAYRMAPPSEPTWPVWHEGIKFATAELRDKFIEDTKKQREAKPDAYRDALDSISAATHENPPKWSPEWGVPHTQRKGYNQGTVTSGSARILQNGRTESAKVDRNNYASYLKRGALDDPPNCDGLTARDIRAPRPLKHVAIRDHDERLNGAEDRL